MLGSGIVSARDPFRTTKTAACPLQGNSIGLGYRLDFLVAGMVLVEVKAIDALLPIHQAQLLSYLTKAWPVETRTIDQLSCSFTARGYQARRAWPRRIDGNIASKDG